MATVEDTFKDYDAIDFVAAYARSVEKDSEYEQVDDMLRAAAVLTVQADKMLKDTLPKEGK